MISGIMAGNRLQRSDSYRKRPVRCPGRPAFRRPALIEHIGSVVPHIFYVRTDRHPVQLDKLTMLLIVDFRSRTRGTRAPG